MNKLILSLSSYTATLILLFIYAFSLGVATFLEHSFSTEFAKFTVYNSPWFFVLQLLMCFNFAGVIWRYDYIKQKKWAMIAFHSAFVVILLGALATFVLGEEGVIHVREGSTTTKMIVNQRIEKELPFSVTLKEFRMIRYPGSNSPSSYESDLVIDHEGNKQEHKVYMNNIAKIGSYRLYQSSFDKDEKGSVLTVSNDSVGMMISYFGYFLLFAGMILTLISPSSRFQFLRRQLNQATPAILLFLLSSLLLPHNVSANELPQGLIPPTSHAERFGKILVQNPKGRVEPMDTYAGEVLRKINKGESLKGYSSNQLLLALLINPTAMSKQAIIYIDNEELVERFGGQNKLLSYEHLFDENGVYLLTQELQTIYGKDARLRTQSDKAILKLDEKVNILYSLFHSSMLPLFPIEGDMTHKWVSPGDDLSEFKGKDSLFVSKIFPWYLSELTTAMAVNDWTKADEVIEMIDTYQKAKSPLAVENADRIKLELLYNKLDVFKWSFRLYLTFGFLLLFSLIFSMITRSRFVMQSRYLWVTLLAASFLFQTFGIGLRWIVAEHAPWANAYESMIFVGWTALLAGFLFSRKSLFVLAISAVLGGFILLVSQLNFLDPEITPLVPVLKSYWLMVHVAVIMSGYGFFGLSCFTGILSFVLMLLGRKNNQSVVQSKIKELTIINEMSMIVGLILMTAGTFLGAIWANESWGRYWGWDPKETWALVTMIVYALVLHARFIPQLRGMFIFNLLSVVSISSVLMTYFGVNYYLSGLHSYGKSDSLPIQIITWSTVVITTLIVAASIHYRRLSKE